MVQRLPLSLIAATIAINGTAQIEWTGYYIGAADDRYTEVVHAGGGFSYAAGYTVNANGNKDILVSYFDNNGNNLWHYTWNGTADGDDVANDIALTDVGNIVVVGKTWVGAPDDYAGIMLYVIGATGMLWCSQEVNEAPGYPDVFCHVRIRPNDDIFAAGYSQQTSDPLSSQILLASWDDNCGEYFSSIYSHGYRASGYGLDMSGNSYIASTQNLGSDENIVISKFDPLGVPSWIEVYNGMGFQDGANALALDVVNNVYVTGFVSASAAPGSKDAAILKYDALGTFGYLATYDGGFGDDEGVDVVDAFGFPVMSGKTIGSDGSWDVFMTKRDNLGAPFWTRQYNAPGDDEVFDLAGPAQWGDFATAGQFNSLQEFAAWLVDEFGTSDWIDLFQNGGDLAKAFAVNFADDGCVVVSGYARTGTTPESSDAVLRKYCLTVGMHGPTATETNGAHPNPFSDALWLDLALPYGTIIDVDVIDVAGRVHYRGSSATPSPIDLRALADGAYLVRWRAASGSSGRLRVMKGP